MTLTIEDCRAGVGERQARRRALAAGIVEPRRVATPEEDARMRTLLEEGLPPSWVAEELGLRPNTLRTRAARAGIQINPEWRGTRLSIHHDPALRALHEEFAP